MDDNPHSLTSTTKHVLFLTSGKPPFLTVSSACTALGARCPLDVRLWQQAAEIWTSPGSLTTFPEHTSPPKLLTLEMRVPGLPGTQGWNGDLFALCLSDITWLFSSASPVWVFPRGQCFEFLSVCVGSGVYSCSIPQDC